MKSMRGLMHTTSVEATHEQKTTFSTTSVAGHKRRLSNIREDYTARPPASRNTVQFQRAISLPATPPRISASRIVRLDERVGSSEYSQRRVIAATPTASIDPELELSHPTYNLPQHLVDNFASLVLMLKRVVEERGSKALLVLPYVALVQEKVRWLRSVVQGLRFTPDTIVGDDKRIWRRRADEGTIRIVGFFGGGRVRATWADFDIGVCTLEKANALVNTAIDDFSISNLRSVVLDELHMVDDDQRGYLLELVATKLRSLEQAIQIVGMSATLPNMDMMAQWLDGHCYETQYRPIPIEEHLVYDGNIYPAGSTSSLIKTAAQLNNRSAQTQAQTKPIRRIEPSTYKELRDPVLNAVVTLAHETAIAGFGALVFAGSRGMCESDARWISRAMPAPHELKVDIVDKRMDLLGELRSLNTGVDPVLEETVLYGVAFHPTSALLEVISIRLATSHDSILDYFSKSLLSHTRNAKFVEDCISSSLKEIESMGFIARDDLSIFTATQLGRAIVASAIDPDDGVFVHNELSRALQAFVMDGEMHVLYTFTPVQESGVMVNWQVFRNEMERLDESGLRVLRLLGIKPTTILKLAQGATLRETTQEEKQAARVHRRFYLALQLRDLCNEVPIHIVARKYDVPRGMVQNLSQTCQGFAAGMIKFCEQMSWGVMAAALDHFSDRLVAGARADLLALAKIPFIKSRTARVFWENGFRTVATIANADPTELLPVLMQAQPNKIRLKGKDNEKYEEKLLVKAKVVSDAASKIWRLQMQAELEEE
ncbi:hypothetical protein F66182_7419 [Fusarium sp. NRRL 66182]|nr:hypothetical protein F66182_7419 [Fusarium sp. NRRL 66182]